MNAPLNRRRRLSWNAINKKIQELARLHKINNLKIIWDKGEWENNFQSHIIALLTQNKTIQFQLADKDMLAYPYGSKSKSIRQTLKNVINQLIEVEK